MNIFVQSDILKIIYKVLKNSIFSSRPLFLLMFVFIFYFNSNAQNPEIDSAYVIEEKIIEKDSLNFLKFENDSIIYEQIQDTIRAIINIADTIGIYSDSLKVMFKVDTITSIESILNSDSLNLYLNYLGDSLCPVDVDTTQFIISNLNRLLLEDSVLFTDTLKQAVRKLIGYTKVHDIKPVLNYLGTIFEKSDLLFEESDSSLVFRRDSIFNAIQYLINTLPVDSTKFYVTNINNDSIAYKSAANENDSIHVNLYDNRGEYAVLWIKKSDSNVYEIYLEDGTYIEKAKQQRIVNKGVGSTKFIPKLKKVKRVNIIIPIWLYDGLADIRFNQGYISKSWAEGGENSLAALSILKYSVDYNYGKLRNFDSDVEYRLGYLQAGENAFLQKNDDKFELNLKYGTTAFKNWYYSALLNFKTQLLRGYEYIDEDRIAISQILSPAHLVFSLGLDYKPSNKLTMLLSPLTSKFTIVADTVKYDQTRFGLAEDEIVRKELGAYIKAISKIKIKNNLTLENKVNFFTNYVNNPQNIDVDWEIDLIVKLTDYINMSINGHFIYDDDVAFIDKDGDERGARSQFKELFGVGFSYNF